MKFKKGDIVFHKATYKRCVVSGFNSDNTKVEVDTADGEQHIYYAEETLYSQEEYNSLLLVGAVR